MKYDHEIIRDLMPLCIDGIASEKSQKAVKEHIAECPDCEKEWEQMQTNIEQSIQEPLPEPTAKYAETATRVRKKNRWLLLKATLLMLAAVFAVLTVRNWSHGCRYSSKTIARKCVRQDWNGDDDWICEQYNLQEKCSFSKLKLHYAGQVTSPDHTFREVFVTADIPGSDTIGLWCCPMNRVNPLLLGMWEGDGYGSGGFSKDEKLISLSGRLTNIYSEKSTNYWAFLSMDPNVKHVNVEISGENQTVELHDGFGYFVQKGNKYSQEASEESITKGKALDKDGNVLYRAEEVKDDAGNVVRGLYHWVKAE